MPAAPLIHPGGRAPSRPSGVHRGARIAVVLRDVTQYPRLGGSLRLGAQRRHVPQLVSASLFRHQSPAKGWLRGLHCRGASVADSHKAESAIDSLRRHVRARLVASPCDLPFCKGLSYTAKLGSSADQTLSPTYTDRKRRAARRKLSSSQPLVHRRCRHRRLVLSWAPEEC